MSKVPKPTESPPKPKQQQQGGPSPAQQGDETGPKPAQPIIRDWASI